MTEPFSIHYDCRECHTYDTYHAFYNDGWSIDTLCMKCHDQGKARIARAIAAKAETRDALQRARKAYKAREITRAELEPFKTADDQATELVRYYKRYHGWNRVRMHTDPSQRIPFASRAEAMEACAKG